MVRAIVSAAIMLVSAVIGLFVGAEFNDAGVFGLTFAVIAGFACTIYAVENRND